MPASTLVVVGSYLSPYVRKVLAVLEHKVLPYQVDPIVPFSGNDAFARLSPARRVPVLIDGDTVIAGSSVVVEYLEKKWPTPSVLPSGPAERAHARRLEQYADSVMGEVFIRRYFNQLVINHFDWGHSPEQQVVEQARNEEIPQILDYLEGQLPERGTLFDALSVADIAIASFFRNLSFAAYQVEAARWPRTAAFVQRMQAEPCLAALVPFEKLSLRTPIAQQREALSAAGAPITTTPLAQAEPRPELLVPRDAGPDQPD